MEISEAARHRATACRAWTGSAAECPGQGERLVRMRAPTGEEQWVPSSMAPQYQQRGAQVVG